MNFNRTDPLTTEFLLGVGNQEKPCPSYYGKDEDKKKVKMVLQQEIHPEVHAKWGNLMCHCQRIPKIRLSKTAKNLNKVFLTCGGSTQNARCKFFQWIHTPLYPLPSDPMPDWLRKTYKPRPLKSFTKENRDVNPYKIPLPSTFHWSPEIAEVIKKR
ncbi:unnamed protein product, partial [Porites lobata]